MCVGCLLKRINSKQYFNQSANNFQLAFGRLFSHPYCDCCSNGRLTQETENHLIPVKGEECYEIPHLPIKGTKA